MLAAAVLSMFPLLALSLIVSSHARNALLERSANETAMGLQELDRFIAQKVESYQVDAVTIANYPPLAGIDRAKQHGGIDPTDNSTLEQWQSRLSNLFLDYAAVRPAVQQVRHLDAEGNEWLRIDQTDGTLHVVPSAALQDKSDRDYFQRAAQLSPGQCYISPISLNYDHGQFQRDNPVLRISTPLWNEDRFLGVVVLNISAEAILAEVKQHFDHGRIILATESGTYMSHPDPDRRWGNQVGHKESLYKDWPNLTLSHLLASMDGHGGKPVSPTKADAQIQLTLSYVHFDEINEGWIIGLERDRADVIADSVEMNRYILITTGVVGLLAMLSAFVGSSFLARPLKQLAAAADTLRNGDYSARVASKRRDEIGEMAESFNRMAQEIGQAHEAQVQRAKAEAANRAKSAFLANMSHEIRTPMNAILGFADLLAEDSLSEKDRANYIQTIRRNGDHLLCLINDVLDLSKVEAGKMSIEMIRTSVPEMIERVASLMRPQAENRGLSVKVLPSEDLPQYINTDPVRLRQILLNLMGNAVKFTEQGSVSMSVTRHDSEKPGHCRLRFEIRDTGIGIPSDKIDRLFKPFSQADESTTRNFGGTGLGLTLAKNFAQLLDGDITVQSTPGIGSVFALNIEARVANPAEIAKDNPDTSQAQALTIKQDNRLAGRVLLAEDGPDNQRLIQFHLSKIGLNHTLCANGKDASDLALEQRDNGTPFDVILMDMQMPVMDGYTATRRLREAGYTGWIVALTAHAMNGDRERCINAGCDEYETKPINRATLHKLLERLLEQRRAA